MFSCRFRHFQPCASGQLPTVSEALIKTITLGHSSQGKFWAAAHRGSDFSPATAPRKDSAARPIFCHPSGAARNSFRQCSLKAQKAWATFCRFRAVPGSRDTAVRVASS